jgi:hypothetical protein
LGSGSGSGVSSIESTGWGGGLISSETSFSMTFAAQISRDSSA